MKLDKIIKQLDTPSKYKLQLSSKYLNKIVSSPYYWERNKLICSITKEPYNKCIIGLQISKMQVDTYTHCDTTVIGHTKHCDDELNIDCNYISKSRDKKWGYNRFEAEELFDMLNDRRNNE